jgi:hypothetical protein
LTHEGEGIVRQGLEEIKEGKYRTFANADELLAALNNDD